MNVYVLSFNPLMTKLEPAQLLAFISEARRVEGWYSPFVGTYYIKSSDNIIALTQMFNGVFAGELHSISQVFPSHMGGSLPPSVWQWLGGMTSLAALANFGRSAAGPPPSVPPAPPPAPPGY